MPDKTKLVLPILLSSATLTVMAGAIISPVLNLMRDALGIEASYVGLIITTHGLFMAIFSPLMGSLIDKKGIRSPYITGLIVFGVAGSSGLVINNFWVLLASRAIMGIALASIFTCINVLILNIYEGRRRNKIMGWRGSAQSLGGIMWPSLGGALGVISWHLPFSIYLVSIPIGIAAFWAVYDPIVPDKNDHKIQENLSIFSILKNHPIILIIFGLMFFSSFQLYAVIVYLPQLLELFGLSSTLKIGLFITAMATASGAISLVYGKIRGSLSYKAISITGVIIWAIAFFSISKAQAIPVILLSVFLLGAGQGLIMPTVMVWIGDVVPVSFRGRFSSYLGTFGYMGQFLSPLLLAPALIHLGIRGVFSVASFIGVVWFIILISFVRNRIST